MSDTFTLGKDCTLTIGGSEVTNAKTVTIDVETALADATTRAAGGFKVEIPTLKTLKISFEMAYVAGDAVFAAIKAAFDAGTKVAVVTADYSADFYVAKLSRKEPLEEIVTYDVELSYAGAAGSGS